MKKYLLIVLCALVLVVTGCGKKNQVVCTKTTIEGEVTIKEEGTFVLDKDDKVESADAVYTFNDEDLAKNYCDLFKTFLGEEHQNSISCSSTKITIKDLHKLQDEEDGTVLAGMKKDELIKFEEEQGYSCK